MGRTVMQPRLIAYQADGGELAYTYSGLRLEPERWHPGIASLKREVEAAVGVAFNSCLLNFYRSGADSIGWHSDSEPLYGREPTIATVSLGDPREFLLRRNADHSERYRFRLGGGALLVMSGPVQEQHALVATTATTTTTMDTTAATTGALAGRPVWGRRAVLPSDSSNPPSQPGANCGTEAAALELTYAEFDSDAFEAGVGRFAYGLSELTDVRLRCIAEERDPARRRALLADAAMLVSFQLQSDDATAVAQALTAAALDGTLDDLLELLGGQLSGYTIVCKGNTVYSKASVTTRSIESPAPAPTAASPAGAPSAEQLEAIPATLNSMPWAAAEAPSQAPVGSTTATTAAAPKKKSNLGAILGGAIGGGVGGLVVLGAAAYFLLRKKGSSNSAYSVGNPTYAPQSGTTATVTVPKGAPAKAGLELEEVVEQTGTPRSARRRNATPFQEDGSS
ncbi:hypothetical protein COHA_000497 [Chlorella ohadii]|uniref:Fe2OG dioxygenase domain-containing protein n=1 Tax=Chlorella ohadii TaxID=2649997 RepID=A0AAD5DZI3_9CHLO|nr:hypothetical protein COHA_000497 [Chlorella ohadii]